MALYPRPAGCAGHRLRKVLGMSEVEYLESFERINLCATRWDKSLAERLAAYILSTEKKKFILLGARVTRAFGLPFIPFSSHFEDGKVFVVFPHPSGRCRIWNDKKSMGYARDRAEMILDIGLGD